MEQAELARDRLSRPTMQMALGSACYQQGELHRLRGEFAKAEDAYGLASRYGREPQPGMALLRLGQHRLDAAAAMSRRVVGEVSDWTTRSRILPAHIEIMLAMGDLAAARAAVDEFAGHTAKLASPMLRATAAQALGAVLVAEGEGRAALGELRRSYEIWTALDVPYEAARTRVLIGAACAALGDKDSAMLEVVAARRAFEQLGAVVDLRGLGAELEDGHVLTPREVQVLGLVAGGLTNRAIADELVLSERTVERHMSNIFRKLAVGSRSAATAYAFEHGLV
jgi:ATP/maltotriose-dependent transcriptional regulator MalT